jgi:hypothetical protein
MRSDTQLFRNGKSEVVALTEGRQAYLLQKAYFVDFLHGGRGFFTFCLLSPYPSLLDF